MVAVAQGEAGEHTRASVDDESVDDELLDEVLTATRALVAVVTRTLGPLGEQLPAAQYRALVVLASHGPLRLSDLAEELRVAASTAGRMCDRLVRKGLVQRRRAAADRRIVRVTVSRAGREALDLATARRRQALAGMLAGLTPSAQRTAAQTLRALTAAVGEIPDRDWPAEHHDEPPSSSQRRTNGMLR